MGAGRRDDTGARNAALVYVGLALEESPNGSQGHSRVKVSYTTRNGQTYTVPLSRTCSEWNQHAASALLTTLRRAGLSEQCCSALKSALTATFTTKPTRQMIKQAGQKLREGTSTDERLSHLAGLTPSRHAPTPGMQARSLTPRHAPKGGKRR